MGPPPIGLSAKLREFSRQTSREDLGTSPPRPRVALRATSIAPRNPTSSATVNSSPTCSQPRRVRMESKASSAAATAARSSQAFVRSRSLEIVAGGNSHRPTSPAPTFPEPPVSLARTRLNGFAAASSSVIRPSRLPPSLVKTSILESTK